MKSLLVAVLVACAVLPARAQAPQTRPNGPLYVVAHVDVVRQGKAQAMTLLKQYAASCARESGNLRCEAIQRMEQQNQFAVLEVWKDQPAFQAHAAGSGAQLRARLKPLLASPYDERVHSGVAVLPPRTPPSGRVVYVIAHVDVAPARADEAAALLAQMAQGSRRNRGNERLEVLRQAAPAANLFTIVEIWGNKRLLDAHHAVPSTIQFRDKLQPMIGPPYDERVYKVLD